MLSAMQTVELNVAQKHLAELILALAPGDEVVIERNHEPVARLLSTRTPQQPRPLPEFAGKFRPLPQAEMDNLKEHDSRWCDPTA